MEPGYKLSKVSKWHEGLVLICRQCDEKGLRTVLSSPSVLAQVGILVCPIHGKIEAKPS